MVTEPTIEFQNRLIQRLRREVLSFKSLAKSMDSDIPVFLKDEVNPAIQPSFSNSILSVYRLLRVQQNTIQEYERKQSDFTRKVSDLEKKIQQVLEKYRSSQATIESMKMIHEQETSELRKQLVEFLSTKKTPLNTSSGYLSDKHASNVYYPRIRELSMEREPSVQAAPAAIVHEEKLPPNPELHPTQNFVPSSGESKVSIESNLQQRMESLETENKELSVRIQKLIWELQESRERERIGSSPSTTGPNAPHSRQSRDRTPLSRRNSPLIQSSMLSSSTMPSRPTNGLNNTYLPKRHTSSRDLSPIARRPPTSNTPITARLSRSSSMSSLRSDTSVDSNASASTSSRSLGAQRVLVSNLLNSKHSESRSQSFHFSSAVNDMSPPRRRSFSSQSVDAEYVSPYAQRGRRASRDSEPRSKTSQGPISHRGLHASPNSTTGSRLGPQSRDHSRERSRGHSPASQTSRSSKHSAAPHLTPRRASPTSPVSSLHSRSMNQTSSSGSTRSRLLNRMEKSPARSPYVSPYNQNVLQGRNPSAERRMMELSRRGDLSRMSANSARSPRVNRQFHEELERSVTAEESEHTSSVVETERELSFHSQRSVLNSPKSQRIHSSSVSIDNSRASKRIVNTGISHDADGYSSTASEGISVDLSAKRDSPMQSSGTFPILKDTTVTSIPPGSISILAPLGSVPSNEVKAPNSSDVMKRSQDMSQTSHAHDPSEQTHGSVASFINALRVDNVDLSLPSLSEVGIDSELSDIYKDYEQGEINISTNPDDNNKSIITTSMDISVDIDDIDKRLASLQEFLSSALS